MTKNYRIEVMVNCTKEYAHELADELNDFVEAKIDCDIELVDADSDTVVNTSIVEEPLIERPVFNLDDLLEDGRFFSDYEIDDILYDL
jgi:hypothetical protein